MTDVKKDMIARIENIDKGRFVPFYTENKEAVIKEGTHGGVILCTDIITNKSVAVKEIKNDTPGEGVAVHAMREIAAYKRIGNHENVLRLLCVVEDKTTYVILEGMIGSIRAFTRKLINLTEDQKRKVKRQIANGLDWCHEHRIMHRDIKPENIMYDDQLRVCIGDFGLATIISPKKHRSLTIESCTLWYRPLELLMETSSYYSEKIDIWAMACVFFEIDHGYVLFPGDSLIGQIFKICETLSSPSEETLPGWSKFAFVKFTPHNFPKFKGKLISQMDECTMKMLNFDETKRPSAKNVKYMLL